MVDSAAAVDAQNGAEDGTVGIRFFLMERVGVCSEKLGRLRVRTVLVKVAAEFRQLDADAFIASR